MHRRTILSEAWADSSWAARMNIDLSNHSKKGDGDNVFTGRGGFTLIELLVVVAIIGVLMALMLPVLGRAKKTSQQTVCASNLRQIGMALAIDLEDRHQRFPDRRDLKQSLPGGYRPWTTWPKSDPRSGWAAIVLKQNLAGFDVWTCPAIIGSTLVNAVQSVQAIKPGPGAPVVTYWMWRFDRFDDPIPQDNFWDKTIDTAVHDLRAANNPFIGVPSGLSEVEMMVDPYYPNTISSLPPAIRGLAVHSGGRNRLFLDWHVEFFRDRRTR